MTLDDVDAVYGIECSSFSEPWSKSSLRAIFQYQNLNAIVAQTQDKISGYILLSHSYDEGEILRIACHPDFRRRGISKLLLGNAILLMKQLNVVSVFLEVRSSNIPAQNLYLGSGFKNVGFRKNYYKNPTEDALLLRMDISQTND